MRRALLLLWLVEVYALTFACILTPGCITTAHDYGQAQEQVASTVVSTRTVAIGVQNTADGTHCGGAWKDVATVAATFSDPVTQLIDRDASLDNIQRVIYREAWAAYSNGQVLVICNSGHGGETPDLDGDEPTGKDQFLVLFDGQWLDDNIWLWICDNLPSIRILLLTDTCHAESMWRLYTRMATGGVLCNQQPQMLLDFMRDMDRFGGEIIQIAGCWSGGSSYGDDENGGNLTQTFCGLAGRGLSITNQFRATYNAMPRYQKPVWTEHNASDEFRNAVIQWRTK